jgi:biotin carboxyl carrier protein
VGEGLEITALGRGRYLVFDGQRQRLAYAAGPPDSRWVFLDGRVYVVDTVAPRGRLPAGGHDDHLALAAPMPATVAAIHVTPGQEVTRGDVLVMLEAMKMELPVKAPRDGRVKGIACTVGSMVEPGVALVELE